MEFLPSATPEETIEAIGDWLAGTGCVMARDHETFSELTGVTKKRRSSYWPPTRRMKTPVVYLNERGCHTWRVAGTLAHEAYHHMDEIGEHPLCSKIGKARSADIRYRQELPAVTGEIRFLLRLLDIPRSGGAHNATRRQMEKAMLYLAQYERRTWPRIEEVLFADWPEPLPARIRARLHRSMRNGRDIYWAIRNAPERKGKQER